MFLLSDGLAGVLRLLPPLLAVAAALSLWSIVLSIFKWSLWLLLSAFMGVLHLTYGAYQGACVFVDLLILTFIKSMLWIHKTWQSVGSSSETERARRLLWKASTYREWVARATALDRMAGRMEWRESDEGFPAAEKLRAAIAELKAAREDNDHRSVIFHLPAYVKRNHLGIDDLALFSGCFSGTKHVINEYLEEIRNCTEYLGNLDHDLLPLHEKIGFFGKVSRNLGQTALCLSGGGSLAMYHMGVLRALIESDNYSKIHVVSGTSGGSICAAMCACKTEAELMDEVLVDVVSTDYRRNGVMKRDNIVWFPPLWRQMINFLTTGMLIDSKEYCRTCEYYWGDTTFAEAYMVTKKHVCITVTAANRSSGPNKLLLNHISTPHVLLRSAVAASCALPGIMASNQLLYKTREGRIAPFEVDGDHWVDGSFEADIPFKRMSTLFSVTNFIVSQVNFHVVPFLQHKLPGGTDHAIPHSPGSVVSHSYLKTIMSTLDLDLRHRVLTLSGMGLLPKWYGQDMAKLLKQNYKGDVTIVPELKIDESLGIKAVMNPTVEDMMLYLRDGRRACWPHLPRIRHLLTIESCIHKQLQTLLERRSYYGIGTAFELSTSHGLIGMSLMVDAGDSAQSYPDTNEGDAQAAETSDEENSSSATKRGRGSMGYERRSTRVRPSGKARRECEDKCQIFSELRTRCSAIDAKINPPRVSALKKLGSVSDFLVHETKKQTVFVEDMTDLEIKQKIVELESEVSAYKAALTKRLEAENMFSSFYY